MFRSQLPIVVAAIGVSFFPGVSFSAVPTGRAELFDIQPLGQMPPPVFSSRPDLQGRMRDGANVPIPLIHTSVEVDIRGPVASTTVVQVYQNSSSEPVEAVYTFPLPHAAAVYDMEARIGDRIIRSDVQEKQQARQTYEKAKSNGQRAALVESERPNIFNTSIANLMPGDRIDLTIRIVERLAWDAGHIRYVFPTVVAPRFIPPAMLLASSTPASGGMSEVDAISPPIASECARAGHEVSFAVRADLGVPRAHVSSPSHAWSGGRDAGGRIELELAAGGVIPDRDVIIDFSVPQDDKPRTALFVSPRTDDESQFMFVAYPPRASAAQRRAPIEWLFLCDVSGSMMGASMEQARAALLQAFERMRAGDRFNIIPYNHTYWSFRSESVPVTPANIESGQAFVRGLDATGGTMMLPGLKHLMALPRFDGVTRYVILMTDGELGNENEIFRALAADLGDARLFVVTVGSAPNHFLAAKMAEFGRGAYVQIASGNEIELQMNNLLNKIQSPVLSNISLAWRGVETDAIYPAKMPDLFIGQPLVVFGRMRGAKGTLMAAGMRGGSPLEQEHGVDVKNASFHPAITTLWARELVEEQLDAWRKAPTEVEREQMQDKIVSDAIAYRLVTQFTSLVAVEERLVNEGGVQNRVRVPVEMPAGMNRRATIGENAQGGTADAFLELMAVMLVLMGVLLRRMSRVPAMHKA